MSLSIPSENMKTRGFTEEDFINVRNGFNFFWGGRGYGHPCPLLFDKEL